MATENSLITLLQPPAPVENQAIARTRNSGEEDEFRNMLEEASRNVKHSEESASTRKDRQSKSALSDDKQKTDLLSGSADSGKRTEGSPELKDNEIFGSEFTSANQGTDSSQGPSQEGANSLTDSQNAFLENLKSLGVDQEKIDAFLRLLEGNATGTDTQELIAVMASQLGLQQGEKLTSDRLTVDFLLKAGLSEAEAKNFLQKIAQVKTDVLNLQETRDIKSGIASGTQSQGDTARAAHAQARQTEGGMVAELVNEQRLEAQKLNFREQITKTSEGLSSERIETQDPLTKILNSPQFQQNSSSENAPQSNMMNSLNLRDSQNNVPSLDQGLDKISAESLARNNVHSVEKVSGQTEVLKETIKEAPLPRGVTESKVIGQIVRKFAAHGAGAKNEIHIRLEPPSLGTIRVNISTLGDVMKTTVIAENHAVRQVIENNLSQLKDSLSQQGFAIESFDVLVGGDSGFKGQEQQMGNGRSKSFFSGNSLDQEALESLAQENSSPLFAGIGKINVFV